MPFRTSHIFPLDFFLSPSHHHFPPPTGRKSDVFHLSSCCHSGLFSESGKWSCYNRIWIQWFSCPSHSPPLPDILGLKSGIPLHLPESSCALLGNHAGLLLGSQDLRLCRVNKVRLGSTYPFILKIALRKTASFPRTGEGCRILLVHLSIARQHV